MTGERELTAKVVPVRRVRSAPKTGFVGTAEIVGLSASALLLLFAVVAYFYLVIPARSHLRALESDRSAAQDSIKLLTTQVGAKGTAAEQIAALTSSLTTFEQYGLTSQLTGRTALYDQLNLVIRNNNLRNTAGPAYTALDPMDPNAPAATRTKSGNARYQSFYPGIAISVTVEGTYSGVRQFVHDVEAIPQFVIVNSVELEDVVVTGASAAPVSTEEPTMLNPRLPGGGGPGPRAAAPRTPTSAVSLRLDLTVYFRRHEGAVAPAVN
jgi:hypothetical protein